MNDPEQTLVRRALEAALAGLESGSSGANGQSSPVVLVVLSPAGGAATAEGSASRVSRDPGSAGHPSVEKFSAVETADQRNEPKHCFIEPERRCVNSGACEMRGF